MFMKNAQSSTRSRNSSTINSSRGSGNMRVYDNEQRRIGRQKLRGRRTEVIVDDEHDRDHDNDNDEHDQTNSRRGRSRYALSNSDQDSHEDSNSCHDDDIDTRSHYGNDDNDEGCSLTRLETKRPQNWRELVDKIVTPRKKNQQQQQAIRKRRDVIHAKKLRKMGLASESSDPLDDAIEQQATQKRLNAILEEEKEKEQNVGNTRIGLNREDFTIGSLGRIQIANGNGIASMTSRRKRERGFEIQTNHDINHGDRGGDDDVDDGEDDGSEKYFDDLFPEDNNHQNGATALKPVELDKSDDDDDDHRHSNHVTFNQNHLHGGDKKGIPSTSNNYIAGNRVLNEAERDNRQKKETFVFSKVNHQVRKGGDGSRMRELDERADTPLSQTDDFSSSNIHYGTPPGSGTKSLENSGTITRSTTSFDRLKSPAKQLADLARSTTNIFKSVTGRKKKGPPTKIVAGASIANKNRKLNLNKAPRDSIESVGSFSSNDTPSQHRNLANFYDGLRENPNQSRKRRRDSNKEDLHDRQFAEEKRPNTSKDAKQSGICPSSFHRKSHEMPNSSMDRYSRTRNSRMKLRSIALQKHKHDEVIDILSDSSDEEQPHQDNHLMDSNGKSAKDYMKKDNPRDSEEMDLALRKSPVRETESLKRRTLGDRKKVDAVRIAIGKKVLIAGCELSFQPSCIEQFIQLSYRKSDHTGNTNSVKEYHSNEIHRIYLDGTITEMKYFIAEDDGPGSLSNSDEDEPMSFLVMRVTPNSRNELVKFNNSYISDVPKNGEISELDKEKWYIVVEVRNNDDFKSILSAMRNNEHLMKFLAEGGEIPSNDTRRFLTVLEKHVEKENQRRMESIFSPRKRTRQTEEGGKPRRDDDEVLLVYPFTTSSKNLEMAAEKLREGGGQICHFDNDDKSVVWKKVSKSDNSDLKQNKALTKSGRTHYLTIRVQDLYRLECGEFLNDTLIDFWMRWISRNENPINSDVHFFTSHFFTTLTKDGIDTVTSWTAKKNINIFEKKFIFIPINERLHWSLCVVVNPANIERVVTDDLRDDCESPCILFLDSLKAHRKARVAKAIRGWLNSEAKRLAIFPRFQDPFHPDTITIIDPKIPYQDNCWDCGIFVCRYAYSLLLLRKKPFTVADIRNKFVTAITESAEFQFDMSDIARLRQEIRVLIDNLSHEYKKMKDNETEERRRRKEAKAKAVKSQHSAVEEFVDKNGKSGRGVQEV